MTVFEITDEEQPLIVPAGSLVWYCNELTEWPVDTPVIIEARGNTNYSNQRRALTPEHRIHWFWIQAKRKESETSPTGWRGDDVAPRTQQRRFTRGRLRYGRVRNSAGVRAQGGNQ